MEELCEQLPVLTNLAATVRTTHRASDTRRSIAPPRGDCTPKFVPGNSRGSPPEIRRICTGIRRAQRVQPVTALRSHQTPAMWYQ